MRTFITTSISGCCGIRNRGLAENSEGRTIHLRDQLLTAILKCALWWKGIISPKMLTVALPKQRADVEDRSEVKGRIETGLQILACILGIFFG